MPSAQERPRKRVPPLHVVTDDAVVARADFIAQAVRFIAAGGAELAFHLRAPRTSGRRVHDLAVELRSYASDAGALLLVNDRVDVAMAAGADGVHLGRRSLSPADARALLGPERWIGASVHSGEEAREAVEGGADFLVAGAVYETASHPGRSAAGLGLIEQAASLGVPVIAIGGVTAERVAEVRSAGAAGVAVLRGVWDAADGAEAVERYLRAVG